jgi:two-component system, NarL family, nitrate/nitrite response regulator NarL
MIYILLESQDGLTVVGEASNAAEAMDTLISERPDIILLDLDVANDLDWLPELYRITPPARVIVLTGRRDSDTHRHAVRLGAMGLVRKEQASEVLLQAITKVHAGEVWLKRTLVADVLEEMTRKGGVQPADPEAVKIDTLTPREREVITLVGRGLKNRQNAGHLCIAEATVRHHLTSIFAKLNVADRLELVTMPTGMASPAALHNHAQPCSLSGALLPRGQVCSGSRTGSGRPGAVHQRFLTLRHFLRSCRSTKCLSAGM